MSDSDILRIGSYSFSSRLLVGTGKYKDLKETGEAIKESGAEVVTVALRRTNIGQNPEEENLLDVIDPNHYTILPNTAGCYDADAAIRTCRLARELLNGHRLVKLEVLTHNNNLLPNMHETINAAKILVNDGFEVMVYCTDDIESCIELDDIGCVAIMPLASPIGTGIGISNPEKIKKIISSCSKPVIVDAGIGAPSDAVMAMELGCDGVLMNTAIAAADNPILMASAMKDAVISGRKGFLAGRMKKHKLASPSSPTEGIID